MNMPTFRTPRSVKARNEHYRRILTALTTSARLKIIKCLLKRPMNVATLAKRIRSTHSNTSRHLRVMRRMGIVECRVSGLEHVYSIAVPLRKFSRGNPILDLGWCKFRCEQL
jgi:DNA-binding transcriptional ArsR family regulator